MDARRPEKGKRPRLCDPMGKQVALPHNVPHPGQHEGEAPKPMVLAVRPLAALRWPHLHGRSWADSPPGSRLPEDHVLKDVPAVPDLLRTLPKNGLSCG